ncbi:hypothetical protein PP187_gp071 [Klebsiella phage vB_KvM-Eowyn]|uniref:Uncharacterized protein n=1 Tax=Klebsiella phage vB_KvM-Eowyn TaxID=2762819 RepID=A0A7R8MMJ3_9CAUD|nr:hypothetical protein PP187_gp071 [Klebsiella phage vB_KvM-Eowyn]CAD5236060.1 hypothetical protein LLCLJKAH_00071 [Klebsiella phage vB_KvM-Eowyn]
MYLELIASEDKWGYLKGLFPAAVLSPDQRAMLYTDSKRFIFDISHGYVENAYLCIPDAELSSVIEKIPEVKKTIMGVDDLCVINVITS